MSKQKKYHYIYKTTCKVTGKFYVGMHSTDNLDDGYLGSGKILGYSRRKYGDENHMKEILEFVQSRDQLKCREKEIVCEELLKDPLNINLKYGGEGGQTSEVAFAAWQGEARREETSKRVKKYWENSEYREKFRKISSETMKTKHALGKIPYDNFTGKKHSELTKEKIRQKMQVAQGGEKNSQFGKRYAWVNKDGIKKKIVLERLDLYLLDGWSRGIKSAKELYCSKTTAR